MRLYNTLTREKEPFTPLEPGKVRMYSCGPTVYNFFHIGNARPFIVFDTLRRYLEYRGYEVTFVQNFTDIDDRMIKLSQEAGVTLKAFADRYINEYWQDANGLGIKPADVHPRATESIPEIIALIEKLVEKGHAYEVAGDVYFDTHSFKEYGKLSHYNLEELEAGARIGVDERKRDAMDFALWKAQKPGEPAWESPWGPRGPGLACGMLGHGLPPPGRDHRHPFRRTRSHFPAPRERNRPERGGQRQALCALLAAQRVHQCQQREDVQIPGQLLHRTRHLGEVSLRGRPFLHDVRALPQPHQFQRRLA
jgi:hypothetical protein